VPTMTPTAALTRWVAACLSAMGSAPQGGELVALLEGVRTATGAALVAAIRDGRVLASSGGFGASMSRPPQPPPALPHPAEHGVARPEDEGRHVRRVGLDGGLQAVLVHPSAVEEEHVALVRALAGAIAMASRTEAQRARTSSLEDELIRQAAENDELVRSLESRQDVMVQLLAIQQAIAARAPLQQVMDEITRGTAVGLRADIVGLRVIDEGDAGHATVRSEVGLGRGYPLRAPVGEGVGGAAILEDRFVVIEDYAADPRAMPVALRDGIGACMAAPVHRDGAVVGALLVGSREAGRRFTEHERAALLSFAEVATLAFNDDAARRAMANAVADAEHRAAHDPLHGLPNRALVLQRLEEALARARRSGDDVTVLFIDLDRFKRVNDSFGHSVGDEVLIRVAEQLRGTAREVDLVARLSGDEFVVVAEGLGLEDALALADRLTEAVAAPLPLYGRETVITASVGVRRTGGESSPEQVLQDADVAMYRAKESGRARIECFDDRMRTTILERLEVERWLRHAAQRGELRLHAQPIVGADDLGLAGVEVLVRWEHPEQGLLTPDRFIDVAEEAGFIVAIDDWVLREACAQLGRWRAASPAAHDLRVNVNVSARQFGDQRFVASVEEALADAGLPATLLSLEITESVLMSETATTAATLRALKDLGCRLVIDDFGTGYSSLAYLHRLPVDEVKIDRSFVSSMDTDPEAQVLVRAIVSLANELGLDVVAEGVETVEQRDLLRAIGCDLLQGYLFGPPVDPSTLPAGGFSTGR
jgi:diguanylate cyclase (GGDEF)-like protein